MNCKISSWRGLSSIMNMKFRIGNRGNNTHLSRCWVSLSVHRQHICGWNESETNRCEFTIINVRPVRSSRCGTLIKNRVGFVFLPEWPRHSQAKYSCSKLTNNICYLFPSRKPNARKKTTSNTTLFYLRSFQTQRCGHPVLLPRLHSILFGKIL